jgi:hypothetical protein
MSKTLDDGAPPVKPWRFTFAGRRISVDAGHLALVTALAGWCLWYLLDARAASADIQNLSLIEPVALLMIAVWALIARQTIKIGPAAASEQPLGRTKIPGPFAHRIFGSMALLAIYVTMATFIGFDVATVVYIAAALVLLGERSIITLVVLPVAFCGVAIYLFNTILATPLPILLGTLFGDAS